MECLARLPGRLLLSRRRDGGGRLLRGVLVFALLCAEWRRGGRLCCLRYYDGRRNCEDEGAEQRERGMRSLVSW
jgi:hypothetical protein